MSRTDARSTSLRQRPSRSIPATLGAVLLLALGVGLVWIAVLRLVDGRWPSFLGQFNNWSGALLWGSASTLAVAAGVAALGLIFLIAALTPGKPNAMSLQVPSGGEGGPREVEYVITRRAVAHLAGAHARLIDGVDNVSTVVTHRQVRLRVDTPSEQTAEVERAVTERVGAVLAAAGLHPVPRVSTSARTTSP